jgi:hypothetical protein
MLVEINKIQSISRELVLFYDQRGDLLNSVSVVKWIGITDGKIRIKTDNGEFEFFVYDVEEINDLGVITNYTALDKVLTQGGEYNTRLQDIFKLLVNDILKGCCDAGGGGGSQGLQDVLIVDPNLTQANTIDGGGFDQTITNVSKLAVQSTAVAAVSSQSEVVSVNAFLKTIDATTTAVAQTKKSGGFVSAEIRATDATGQTAVEARAKELRIVTPKVDAGTAVLGQVATLKDAATGEVEYETPAVGVTTYDALTDATTVDLPTMNVPLQTALDGKVDENAAIVGATKTKITYDAKGLVTAGADATTADIADSTNKRYVTDAEQTRISFITVTQAVDLDIIESDTVTNNAKATNATHTGEVTGSGALTVDKTAITNKTNVAAAATDKILIADASDTDNLKYVTAQSIADLAAATATQFQTYPLFGNTVGLSSTRFFSIGGGTGSTTESAIEIKIITACTFTGLGIRTSTAQSGTGSLVVTLRKNGANTAITFTIAAGSAAGYFSDISNSVSFAAGDTICIACVNNATATSATVLNGTTIGQ